ncbi:MAG: alpha-amylase family glycosyl hydrolase, partial [Fulvivirga sp.]|uniref:alpha-amylase family glycosyl hydrolase n=1 Tax=Fulvivirga sp. TaxID=1931237 RepID=UPI0032EF1C2A
LYAPLKTSVYLVGDFNNWIPSTDDQLAKDGDYFWLNVTGLTSGQEYAFQYLVDEEILVGDPYSDKILDPNNDGFIPESTYPNLINYPESEIPEGWVSVMQTAQQEYNWLINDFAAPAKEDLVIYELLVRDFDENQNYEAVINRLDYLKTLGINAIQLMPIMEFDGNNSWGYNPAYFFAPDKYYGTKNNLKAFIDECHSRGIAVILDMVLNHTHERNPIAWMYWDHANFRPAANSPYLNPVAKHPFNVFFDFNHESAATQSFVDTVNYYWLEEYRFDGYRFDLSKGFTQTNSGDNVGFWGQYDQSRVDLLTRMADEIWAHHPDAYIILEHLSDNSEERVLANYGMMLWGNMNHNFNQNTMGYSDGSNLDWAFYENRNWDNANLIPYMESHDEERLVYRNLQNGNSSGGHNTKELSVALERVKSASAIYYAIPGPKMLWQFGELGYDISIDQNGRTGEKPIPWASATNGLGYDEEVDRLKLYEVTSELIKLKATYKAFNQGNFTLDESQTLVKKITLDNASGKATIPADANFVVIANFNLQPQAVSTPFPYNGTWYSYFANGDPIEVSANNESLMLQAGEFRIYSDVRLPSTSQELTQFVQPNAPTELAVSELAGEGVLLNWKDNSSIETTYKVLRSAGAEFEEIGLSGINKTEYLDTTAEPNVDYTYKVAASNANYSTESVEIQLTTSTIITDLENGTSRLLYVYPNPVDNIAIISHQMVKGSYQLMDVSGRVLESNTYQSDADILLDMTNLKKGLYLLKMKGGERIECVKLLKK